ncbi:MAG: bifunctional adenosylcobinamide kinase/adenosylcobinamide-phosphate guanylyltransferase [Firmicutes bacterium]|nr:bifunctional adenosylcobinamide kinase/adenosylcobinamide-phosphate guanylyltransferase [Bacillota bacterium]
MTAFISGGSKSGKSALAEELAVKLAAGGPLYYVATMVPRDGEDLERIAKHREARSGKGFETLECPEGISSCAEGREDGTFLIDSMTALLANMMFKADGSVDEECFKRARGEALGLAERVKNAVFVSDFIYSDAEDYGGLTEGYRKDLALTDRALAEAADLVIEACCGLYTVHKGVLEL